jgi:hypothetical protein
MSNDHDLMALGFVVGDSGELLAPSDSDITLTPIDGGFFRLKVLLADGASIACVVSVRALKIELPLPVAAKHEGAA